MSNDHNTPDFNEFSRWLARRFESPTADAERYRALLSAARAAREDFLESRSGMPVSASESAASYGHLEVLQLLAAADKSPSAHLPELTTARGFRVTLVYDEGETPEASSICVLVRCPPQMIKAIEGETAYLWNSAQRFELGQFDSEGKAIGTLPAGIEISLSDFASGKVKLEEPPPTPEC
jgi:hypothetical protein